MGDRVTQFIEPIKIPPFLPSKQFLYEMVIFADHSLLPCKDSADKYPLHSKPGGGRMDFVYEFGLNVDIIS